MRVLAIDYGDRRTGLAFSDAGGVLCGEAFTVEEWDAERLCERIARARSRYWTSDGRLSTSRRWACR